MRSRQRIRGQRAVWCGLRGFMLLELLVFVAAGLCFVLGATAIPYLSHRRIGCVFGAILGLFGFLLGVMAWCLVADLGVGGIPRLPRCRDGSCRGKDYTLRKFGAEFSWVCRHGRRYRRRGRRFVAVNADGEETAYLIWRPFRGWSSDEEHGPE